MLSFGLYFIHDICIVAFTCIIFIPGLRADVFIVIGRLEDGMEEVLMEASSHGDVEEPVGASPRLKKKTFELFFSPLE